MNLILKILNKNFNLNKGTNSDNSNNNNIRFESQPPQQLNSQPIKSLPQQQPPQPIQPIQQQQQQPPFSIFNHPNTAVYFINTDSIYGNQILPVLPRF
jgi:hypothetical protein